MKMIRVYLFLLLTIVGKLLKAFTPAHYFIVFFSFCSPLIAHELTTVVATGYSGSIPARQLSNDDFQRIDQLLLQDLFDRQTGRYDLLSADGVLETWGLHALVARQAAHDKPYALLRDGDNNYQSERVIFSDLSTAITLMKLTNQTADDGGDELVYYGKSCWNANGSRMVWTRSRAVSLWGPSSQDTDNTFGPLLMNGDGSTPRIILANRNSVGIIVSHPQDPSLGYARSGNELLEINILDGSVVRTIPSDMARWWLKISPDGNYLCDASYSGTRISVVSLLDGTQWDIPLSGPIHDSYRFVPGNTDEIMFWYEGDYPNTQFHNFKTNAYSQYALGFDWNHGDVGRFWGVHTSGRIYAYDDNQFESTANVNWPDQNSDDGSPYYDMVSGNGYLAHFPDDQLWAFPTRIVAEPHLSEIASLFVKSLEDEGRTNRFRVCLTNLRRYEDPRGEKTVVLDRPNISPDGTKILFNSNVFSKAEVYMAVVRKPLPPINVQGRWTENGVALTWEAPGYQQEIKGYRLYRSQESGHGFTPLSAQVVNGDSFLDTSAQRDQVYFYAVRSIEFSQLESELSAEVGVASESALLADRSLSVFAEAERAINADLTAPAPDALWLNIDGRASNLYYIWQRRTDKPGARTLELKIPRADRYYVYARMRGTNGATFTIANAQVSCSACDDWQWVRSSEAVELDTGLQNIALGSLHYGSRLDAFYLSTADDFIPQGRVSALPPLQLSFSGQRNNGNSLLSWAPSHDKRFYYYNLYASNSPDFEPNRETLIASPDSTNFLDWQATTSPTYYKLTQVTLDGLESEPTGPFNAADDNHPPIVDPGADQEIQLPINSLILNATVSDPDLDTPLTVKWKVSDGPGAVNFDNPTATSTGAVFDTAGFYLIELEASDGLLTASGWIRVNVIPAQEGSVDPPPELPSETSSNFVKGACDCGASNRTGDILFWIFACALLVKLFINRNKKIR